MKPGDALIEAARKQAEGEVAVPNVTWKGDSIVAF